MNEALSRAGMVRAFAWANNHWKVVASWLQRPPTSMVHKRLRPTLEGHQSKDQVGFRPCTSVEDGCPGGTGKCLQQVFGMEFPCLVCTLKFEESI